MSQSEVAAKVEFLLGETRYRILNGQFYRSDGELLTLRAKSARVLEYLLEHNEMVVSKESLALAIWPQSVVSDESISKCISDIRKALRDVSHSILETYPKRGYRINAKYDEPNQSRRSNKPLLLVSLILALTLSLVVFVFFSRKDSSTRSDVKLTLQNISVELTGTEKGRIALSNFTYQDNLKAEKYFRTAVDQDPENAMAYAELVATIAIRLENDWAVLTRADEERAFFYAQKAITINPELWFAHYATGRLYAVTGRDLTVASEHLRRAMSLQPASDDTRVFYAVIKIFQGTQNEAIPILEAALASHPNPPFWYFLAYGHALFHAKRYEEAEIPLSTCLNQMPNAPYCLRFQIANFAQLGQFEDADWAIEEYNALGHTATHSAVMDALQDRDSGNLEHFALAFENAGLRD